MRILAISVNHGTTAYMDLMIKSLLDVDQTPVELLVLDNGAADLSTLDWAVARGVTIEPSGYVLGSSTVTTHGEILRDAIIGRPWPDAYLLLDADCFLLQRHTVATMADELEADPGLFAVQARQADENGTDLERPLKPWTREIEERVRDVPDGRWREPTRYQVALGDRAHPFCTLLRNTPVLRRTVDLIGLSPAMTQCERGGRWWDTLGLMTQVMRTHSLDWRYSTRSAGHFGNVSWTTEWSQVKAQRRDRLRADLHRPAGESRERRPRRI